MVTFLHEKFTRKITNSYFCFNSRLFATAIIDYYLKPITHSSPERQIAIRTYKYATSSWFYHKSNFWRTFPNFSIVTTGVPISIHALLVTEMCGGCGE